MSNIGLMDAIGAKISYLSRAQTIVSQNVANADTPGYVPKQLTPVDFGALLGKLDNQANVRLDTTNAGHILPGGTAASAKDNNQKVTYEVAPAGNSVILEEQLTKANDIRMNYEMMVNLYTRNMGMLKTALGTQR